MADSLSDYNAAARMKGVIRAVAAETVNSIVPPDRYAIVVSSDLNQRMAVVRYPGESAQFELPFGGIAPYQDALVRVSGRTGARYISDVVQGDHSALRDETVLVAYAAKTANQTGITTITDVTGLTADLLHPADNGMIRMGENMARILAPVVESLRAGL